MFIQRQCPLIKSLHTNTHKSLILTNRKPLYRQVSSHARCGQGGCSKCWWRLLPYTWRRFLLWSHQSCSQGTDPCVWSSRRNLWQYLPRTLQNTKWLKRDTSWGEIIYVKSNSWYVKTYPQPLQWVYSDPIFPIF